MRVPRPSSSPLVVVRVVGEPKPAGSKVSGVRYRRDLNGTKIPVVKDGRITTFTKDTSGLAGVRWRRDVARAGLQAWRGRELLAEPLFVDMTFLLDRPRTHFRSGRFQSVLRDAAPVFPAVRPDVLKLARAVEDALTGVLWQDDALIVGARYEKVYAEPGELAGVEVRVWTAAMPYTGLMLCAGGDAG